MVYAELNLVLQLSVESETLHKHGQTLSQTAADFQSCVKPSLLSFSICGMHLENYKWEKKASISNILWLYWQYPVGAQFWQTAFWLMLKICTNSLILFLFLKREFRLVSKTKVYLHGYKIWSHTALSRLLNFFLLELKLRLKIILVQCSLKFYLVCGTCIWFMTKFCNHAIWSRIEANWHFVCLPLLYLKILCLFTSHSIVMRYPNRQGFVLQIGNNRDRKDCRKVKKHEYRNDVKQNEGYACPFSQSVF